MDRGVLDDRDCCLNDYDKHAMIFGCRHTSAIVRYLVDGLGLQHITYSTENSIHCITPLLNRVCLETDLLRRGWIMVGHDHLESRLGVYITAGYDFYLFGIKGGLGDQTHVLYCYKCQRHQCQHAKGVESPAAEIFPRQILSRAEAPLIRSLVSSVSYPCKIFSLPKSKSAQTQHFRLRFGLNSKAVPNFSKMRFRLMVVLNSGRKSQHVARIQRARIEDQEKAICLRVHFSQLEWLTFTPGFAMPVSQFPISTEESGEF
jgi:hypothetical protein